MRVLLIGAIASALLSCAAPPLGQIVLHVDTDGWLPPPPGEVIGRDEPSPLFDRLRLEVYPAGANEPCPDCRRDFAVDRAQLAASTLSFGLVPSPGSTGHRARARLYRAAGTIDGEPPPGAALDYTVALPPTASDGILDVTIFMETDTLGMARGTPERPIEPIIGLPGPSHVNGWPGARRVGCGGAARQGEACVPGGAFWMGNPRLAVVGADRQRLVVLSPFFLDEDEVTVSAMRRSGLAMRQGGISLDPRQWSGNGTGADLTDLCTFSDDEQDGRGQLPVNCVNWPKATEYCEARNGRLPTEAEFEYVAGGLSSRLFVWGEDLPECGDAVFAHSTGPVPNRPGRCGGQKEVGGPLLVGSGPRDVLELDGGHAIRDLAGNLREYTVDSWNSQDEPCWGSGIFHDPKCGTDSPSAGAGFAVRGGAWSQGVALMAAAAKVQAPVAYRDQTLDIGFRCVRPARP